MEISVRQHQITISTKEGLVSFLDFETLLGFAVDKDLSFVSIQNDILYFTFGGLSTEIGKKHIFYLLMETIEEFADKVCTCPSLEFIISPQYLKCFLDKPGLTVGNLKDYEDVLEVKDKGELELHPQRPYLLFINENYKEV